MIKTDLQSIVREFEAGKNYNTSIDLYETVKTNENFYIGRQWEGLNAPDLPKPVLNVLRRVVSYFLSMIVSDDVAVSFSPFDKREKHQKEAQILETTVQKAIEQAGLLPKFRDVLRNAAVDGDACLYFYLNTDEKPHEIGAELIDNTNILFANPYSWDMRTQRYILIVRREQQDKLRDAMKKRGMRPEQIERIRPDSDGMEYAVRDVSARDLVTVITKLYRKNGTIHAVECTRDVILRPEWDTQYKRYPIAYMSWEKIKNSYHGQAALTPLIPNQIAINQLFAMGIHSVKSNAFPRIFYDGTKISEWTNRVGQAIRTNGDPNGAVAANFRGADMSAQVMGLIDQLIQRTVEYMGANDAALGNVNPTNSSAILATQKASAMPLELQRFAFYQFVEDCVRVMADIVRTDFGKREVSINGKTELFDFSSLSDADFAMRVDVGAASYWSELMQVQTLDNLFARGIIKDAAVYLESVPEKYIKGKQHLIDELHRAEEEAKMEKQKSAAMQSGAMQGAQASGGKTVMLPDVSTLFRSGKTK